MKTTSLVVLTTFLVVCASGCSELRFWDHHISNRVTGEIFGRNPAYPNEQIRTIAVLPMLNQAETDNPPNMIRFADLFASELIQFRGFQKVIRPGEVIVMMAKHNITSVRSAGDVRELGRLLNADAVVVAAITDFDPYYPPRIGFAVQLYRTDTSHQKSANLESLAQAGKPLPLPMERRDYPLLGGEWIFDLRHNLTRDRFEHYALGHDGTTRALGIESHARIVNEYFRFVCNETISFLIEQERNRVKAIRAKRQRLAVAGG